MAAAQDTARMIVEDRWDQATTRPRRFAGEGFVAMDNSKALYRIRDGIEELGARLVHRSDLPANDDDHGLMEVVEDMEERIHEALVAWAVGIEVERRERLRRELEREAVPAMTDDDLEAFLADDPQSVDGAIAKAQVVLDELARLQDDYARLTPDEKAKMPESVRRLLGESGS